MNQKVIFRNAEEIARFVDYSPKRIAGLVRKDGLPARKIGNRWKANVVDVRGWLIRHVRGE